MGKLLTENAPEAKRSKRLRRRIILPMLAVVLLLSAVGWLAVLSLPWRADSPAGLADDGAAPIGAVRRLATGPQESRIVRLPDGSRLRLGGNTLIEVRLSASERRLRLLRGKARFAVARDARSFIVDAGQGRVTARGTLFDVGFASDGRVTVRLIEGVVDVTLPGRTNRTRLPDTNRRLQPGETLSFSARSGGRSEIPGKPMTAPGEVPLVNPTAARDYETVTVAQLIAAANRASPRPIRLADRATGERLVSGRFRIDDPILLAERLALLFDLVLDRNNPAEVVLRPR
jgi:transmembrane sensor